MLEDLQSIIGRFQKRSAFCEFSEVVESFTAKGEDGLTSYFILDVLEAKIFRYNFMEGHNVWGNVRYSSSIQRNIGFGRQSEKCCRIGACIRCNLTPCRILSCLRCLRPFWSVFSDLAHVKQPTMFQNKRKLRSGNIGIGSKFSIVTLTQQDSIVASPP